jgi:hypothetical protein
MSKDFFESVGDFLEEPGEHPAIVWIVVRGLRGFSMRGREKVSAEWQIMCLTHNLLKLFRAELRPQTA